METEKLLLTEDEMKIKYNWWSSTNLQTDGLMRAITGAQLLKVLNSPSGLPNLSIGDLLERVDQLVILPDVNMVMPWLKNWQREYPITIKTQINPINPGNLILVNTTDYEQRLMLLLTQFCMKVKAGWVKVESQKEEVK